MAHMQIRRIADDAYVVRQYDDVLSVEFGEMSGQTLARHLQLRDLVVRTPDDVLASLQVGDEITVQFRTLL
jgi:hypothetical protein